MRWAFGFLCICTLGVMPLVGCGDDDGGTEGCADWAGQWAASSVSCDGVAVSIPSIDYVFAADCTGEMIFTQSATCESTIQMIFTPRAAETIVDPGAVTCSAECTASECQGMADWGQPFTSTISRSGDTLTVTTLTTAQMVSDDVTPCQVGETQISVLVAK